MAGNAVADDGLVIDLSGVRDVEVDADRRRVRAAGGATIGDVDAATQQVGLAVPLGLVSKTGIAGLTLGGGVGWLRRAYGIACDSMVAAEVVTATGETVRALTMAVIGWWSGPVLTSIAPRAPAACS